MISLMEVTWQEFLLRTLTLHWITATVVVLFVAVMIAGLSRLNATTRHNIWLLTLVSLALMPLLIFAPRPDVELPRFNLSASIDSNQAVIADGVQSSGSPAVNRPPATETTTSVPAQGGVVSPGSSGEPVDARSTNAQISLVSVVKGIFVFWLVGVVFLLRRLWGEYRAARELELQSDSVTPYFERRFDQLCARLGIDERPLLRFHAGINAPMTVGLMRVWVAIPMTWRETIDDSVFDQTLTHELGHIVRKDPAIHTLQRILSIVFWMYPAVWYVSRQLEVERESACDDWVLTHDGKSATYANNLLDVAESLYLQPQVLAVGCLRSHSQLSRRIQNLLNKSSDHKVHNSWKLLALTSVGLMATLSVSAVVWPDARQLAPAAQLNSETSLPDRVAGIPATASPEAGELTTPNTTPLSPVERFSRTGTAQYPTPQTPEPEASARPAQKPSAPTAANNHKNVTVNEDASGKLTIERHRSGKTTVHLKPELTDHEPLVYAAWTGDVNKLKKLVLEKGHDLNQISVRTVSPRTALEAAILKGHKSAVETMIDLGVDLNPDSPMVGAGKLKSPLTVAAMTGRYKIAKLLLKHDAEPGDDTLITAVHARDTRLLDLLLRNNQCNCLKTEEAMLAVVNNQNVRSLDVFLKHNVEVNEGHLVTAVKGNNTKIINKLLNHYDGDVASYLLTLAIKSRNSAVVDSLIRAGAKPDDDAVTLGAQQRDSQLVRKLLSHGAKATSAALVHAVQQRSTSMINALVNAGAPVSDGALVLAIEQRDVSLVHSLVKANPDVREGALVMAIQTRNKSLILMLLDKGAPVGDGALLMAAQTGDAEIIKLIRKRSGRTEEELQSSVLRSFEDDGGYESKYQASVEAQSARYSEAESAARNAYVNTNYDANKYSEQAGFNSASGEFSISKWPVRSNRISLGFADWSPKYGSHSEPHEALDFPMKEGSPVYAVADGYVKESRFSEGYGNYIYIDHGNGYKAKYANNKINKVKKGDYVTAGQKIAVVGNTAKDSTGPHLHFELRLRDKKIDPMLVFNRAQ